ncbi:hypothetical protein COCON_G00119360 [Conger conger]|uniref:Uncharacterized protein n=1 Tax=Conger conger TaxID=82655 RepID=A0A9Q1DGN6_CONCO|nr:hypothetical protein COCON_G00119360 [Conger conger]
MSLDWDVGHGRRSHPLGLARGGTVWGLLDSERRRRGLELSLAKANRALQEQNLRILRQCTLHPSPEDRIPQRPIWALKLGEFKGSKSSGFPSDGFKAALNGDLYERIGRLQSDLDLLSQKVDQEGGHLERLVQDAWARLGVLERDREVLGSQVMGLHSELFQTRSRQQELQRDGVSARAELTGSRQLNDSLLQEVAVLRQRLGSSEQRVALMESERRVLEARLVALEMEREQLLSQKALLVRRLWPGGDLKTDVGGGGREEVEEEVGQEVMKTQILHSHHPSSQEIPESLLPVPVRPLHTNVEPGDQTEDMLKISEEPDNGLEDPDCQQLNLKVSPEVHGHRSVEYTGWREMAGTLRIQKDFLSEMEHVQKGEAIRPDTHLSGESRDDRDVPEGQSSRLCTGEVETASKKCHRWQPWKDDPLSANQITALVIELQKLRRVSRASWEVPDPADLGDQQAREWLERAKLLKDCVRRMEMNEERLGTFCHDHTEEWHKEASPLRATVREEHHSQKAQMGL